jgi:hypothetical protein
MADVSSEGQQQAASGILEQVVGYVMWKKKHSEIGKISGVE